MQDLDTAAPPPDHYCGDSVQDGSARICDILAHFCTVGGSGNALSIFFSFFFTVYDSNTTSSSWISVAHHCRDVDRPDEVTLWTSGHVTLEYVGLSVDSCYFSTIILEVHLLHRPVLSV